MAKKFINWETLTKILVTFKRWNGLKMPNFSIMGFYTEIWFLRGGGGGHKNQCIGVKLSKKESLDSLQI